MEDSPFHEAILLSKPSKDERKTRLKTIRFPESLVRYLEKEAADEGTTVNADVNSIISRHFSWDKKIREFGIVEIPNSMLRTLFEGCNDETLARMGRETFAVQKEMAEFFFHDSSPKAMLDLLTIRSKFNPRNQTRVTQEEDKYAIVMRHDFGPKYTIFAKDFLEEFVKQSFHVKPRISAGESVVTARFKVNPPNSPT